MVTVMPKTGLKKTEYGFVKVPQDLIKEVDSVVGKHGFRSRAEFVKEATRRLLTSYGISFRTEELRPPLEHFNLSENGVWVLDREIEPSKGRIVEVVFKPDRVFCVYDESNGCRHVDFALQLPEVQEILRKKGWKPK